MKKTFILFYILCLYVNGQTFDVETIIKNRSNENGINLVILGDGYTKDEQNIFIKKAEEIGKYILNKKPFSFYKNFINVHAVKIISEESGIKHPGTATDVTEPIIPVSDPNNFLGSSLDIGNTHRCIYSDNINLINNVLADNFPDYDIALIVVNTEEYGGCGGQFAFFSAHSSASEIAVHELGHSFAELADEYWFAYTGESLNKTKDNNYATNRWRNWIGTDKVDIYPFEENKKWFRPHQNCEMRYLDREFCKVCSEAIVEKIHSISNPINSFTPSNLEEKIVAKDILNFDVNLILPEPNYLEAKWTLNGKEIDTNLTKLSIQLDQLNDGLNQLNYSVVDNTPNVRVDNHQEIHVSSIVWSIQKNNLNIDEIKSRILEFAIYPNPSDDYLYIRTKGNNLGLLKAEIYDLNGRLLSTQKINASDSYKINLLTLTNQAYIINIYKDHILIMNQKFIKK